MKKLIQIIAYFFLLVSALPVQAQGHRYMTLGRNPCHRGGYSEQQAQGLGWEVYRFERDEYLSMQGASGEWVSGWLPAGTPAAIEPGGRVRLLACGNPTSLRIRLRTQIKIVERERVVQVVQPPQSIYVFAPTVYPTAPMPQPSVNYTARPPVYANLNYFEDRQQAGINLFNGSAANGGSNLNGNWNDNVIRATGGSTGPINNGNTNTAGSTATNYNTNGTAVGTGTGNVGSNAQTGR